LKVVKIIFSVTNCAVFTLMQLPVSEFFSDVLD